MATGSKSDTYWNAQSVSYLPRTLDNGGHRINSTVHLILDHTKSYQNPQVDLNSFQSEFKIRVNDNSQRFVIIKLQYYLKKFLRI